MIATRRDFEALVFKDRGEPAVLRGWRRGVVGEKLLVGAWHGDCPRRGLPLLGRDSPAAGTVPGQPPAARRNSA